MFKRRDPPPPRSAHVILSRAHLSETTLYDISNLNTHCRKSIFHLLLFQLHYKKNVILFLCYYFCSFQTGDL